MAVFRVERNKGYTVMSNHHLRNKELTLKAKGLLSQMLSRRLGLHPCGAVTDQPGKYRRYPYRCMGAGKSRVYQAAAGTGRKRQNDRH